MAELKNSSMAVLLLALLLVLVSFTTSDATDFLVGGKESSWQIPSSPSEFSRWAQMNRFRVGDYLVWKYNAKNDSVLEVSGQDYETCNTSNPVKRYDDDDTRVRLDRSGPVFFISGAEGHCEKGQKLEVVVLSEDHHGKGEEAASPAPAAAAPAPATHSGAGTGKLGAGGIVLAGLLLGVGSLVRSVLI